MYRLDIRPTSVCTHVRVWLWQTKYDQWRVFQLCAVLQNMKQCIYVDGVRQFFTHQSWSIDTSYSCEFETWRSPLITLGLRCWPLAMPYTCTFVSLSVVLASLRYIAPAIHLSSLHCLIGSRLKGHLNMLPSLEPRLSYLAVCWCLGTTLTMQVKTSYSYSHKHVVCAVTRTVLYTASNQYLVGGRPGNELWKHYVITCW